MKIAGDQQSLNNRMKIESVERRTANYKPNIWNYSHLQTLTNKYDVRFSVNSVLFSLVNNTNKFNADSGVAQIYFAYLSEVELYLL